MRVAASGAAATLLVLEQHFASVDDAIVSSLILPLIQRGQINWFYAGCRGYYQRNTWGAFEDRMTKRQFCLYFRMAKEVFRNLCKIIEGFA